MTETCATTTNEPAGNAGVTPTEIPGLLKDLAEAFSAHAKATNRAWLAEMAVAIFVLARLPKVTAGPAPTIDLPWELGPVPAVYFYVVSTLILGILSIAFCSVHAQMARAHTFVLQAAAAVSPTNHIGKFHVRDVLEVLMQSHVLRLAPLADLVRGDPRFFHEKQASRPRILIAGVYYLVLKVLGMLVYLLLPGMALAVVWRTYEGNDAARLSLPWLQWIVRVFVAFAAVALLQTVWAEIRHALRSYRAIVNERPL
jgi:hypothetical protein